MATQNQIQAHAQSMAKHASIIQSISAAFVTVFAVTDGALFAAFISFLSSPSGQKAIELREDDCWWAAARFALAFSTDCALMGAIIHYCNVKFSYYRVLTGGAPKADDKSTFFGYLSAILCAATVFLTLWGASTATSIVLDKKIIQEVKKDAASTQQK